MANTKALAFKEKGNASFKSGDFPSAIGHYTSAILADRTDVTFPLNRAAAYLKLGKFEDTERDCNTVLTLSAPKSNVKALFRRGQARVGMGKLLEAQKDFSDVLLQEPSNKSAAEELKNLSVLIQKEKAKKSKSPTPVAVLPSSIPASKDTQVKRRRVPIRIVGDTSDIKPSPAPVTSTPISAQAVQTQSSTTTTLHESSSSKTASAETSNVKSTPNGAVDTLQAVSSRSLKSSQPQPPSAPSPNASASSSTPTPASESQTPKPKPSSFKDAKHARESKDASSNTKPPAARVGGGIFRASGASTIFPTRGDEKTPSTSSVVEVKDVKMETTPTTSSPMVAPIPAQTASPMVTSPPPPKAPSTLFEFSKAWYGIKDPWERWIFINSVPPAALPALCKTSLEPSLLVSILDVFLTVLTSPTPLPATPSSLQQQVRSYMDNLARIPRFSTLVLFLSKPEKAVARDVWRALGVERPEGVWKPVA